MNTQLRNIILAIIGTAVIVGGIVWISLSGSSTAAVPEWSASALEVQESFYDFGTISMAAGKVSHAFAVKNTGTEPVNIMKLFTSCMCTVVELDHNNRMIGPFGMQGHGVIPKISELLLPGESAQVIATFDPAAHGPSGTGLIRRIVTVETNSQTKPKLEISFSANVTP